MPIGVTDFAELRAPTRVNPLSEKIKSALSAYYRPQEMSADVGLKQAQANQANATANFTPSQIAATLLSNPTIRDTMDKSTIANLTKLTNDSLNAGVLRQQNQTNSGGPLINLIHSAFGMDHLNNHPALNQNGYSSAPLQSSADIQSNNESSGVVEKSNQPSAQPDSTINRIAAQVNNPGSAGGNNPAAVGEAQEGALKAGATTESTGVANQWLDRHDANQKATEAAQKALIDDDNVLQGYKRLGKYENGPFLGKVMALTKEAQDFDRYANTRADSLATARSNGNLTGPQAEAGAKLKPTRESLPETVEHAMAFDKGLNARVLQRQGFDIRAQYAGLTPQEGDLLWNRYINEKPFWDAKNEKPLPKNLDYESYFSPEKIKWAKNPESLDYTPEADKAKGIQEVNLEGFKSPQEFKSWYDNQIPEVQAAARKQLGANY